MIYFKSAHDESCNRAKANGILSVWQKQGAIRKEKQKEKVLYI